MARSITFVIDDKVDTQITVTENDDGTLTFEILVLDTGRLADIRALFFDLNGLAADDNLSVLSGDHVTESVFDEGNVDTVGGDGNINGDVTNEFGNFDVGIGFGTSGPTEDDLQMTSFTLGHALQPLSLDLIDVSDFGIRTTSVGMKAGDTSNGVGQNDVLEVDENQTGAVDLMANDTNGAELSVNWVHDDDGEFTAVAGGFQRIVVIDGLILGTLTVSEDGTASFAANGADVDMLAEGAKPNLSFTYRTVGADGSLATADVELTINGLNDAPTLEAGTLALDNDASSAELDLALLGDDIDSDDDGATLAYTLVGAPSEGSATINGSQLIFDPGSDFDDLALGETRDVILSVLATDSHGATATATVTVTVTGTNSAPVASTDLTVTDEETVLTGNLFADNGSGVDFDPDGDTFTIHTVDGQPAVPGVPITLSSGATLVLHANGDFVFDPRGAFDFLPEGGQSADGIWYTVIDSNGAVSNEVRANFSVQGVNDAPTLADSTLAATEDGPAVSLDLSALGDDPDNDDTGATLSYVLLGTPGEGTASISGTILSFDPGADFQDLALGATREVVLAVEATDSHGATTTGSVVVTVTGTNDGPIAEADYLATDEITVLTGNLFANNQLGSGYAIDLDPDSGDTFTFHLVDGQPVTFGQPIQLASGALLTLQANGDFTYDPNGAFEHLSRTQYFNDGINYSVIDSHGAVSNTVWANFSVQGVNQAPVAVDDSLSASEDTPMVIDPATLLANDSDVDQGTTLAVASINGQAAAPGAVIATTHGSINVGNDGSLTYTPYENYSGPDRFSYRAVDGLAQSNSATVTIDVAPVADAPTLALTSASGGGDSTPVPTGPDTQINTTTNGTQTDPSVTALDNGGFVVAWRSYQPGIGYDSYFQVYDADGNPVGGETIIGADTAGQQQFPDVLALPGGGFIVAYSSSSGSDASGYGIYTQQYDASGNTVGGEVLVNTTTANSQDLASIEPLDGGGYVVTWMSFDTDGTAYNIYAQSYDAASNPVGGEVLVNSPPNPEYDTYPAAAGLAGGGYVVTWSNWVPGSGQYEAYAQMIDGSGAHDGPPVQLNGQTSSIATYSSVLATPDGGFVVVWTQNNPGENRALVMSRFDADGNLIEGEVMVSQVQPTIQHAPGITLLDDGGFLISWSALNAQDNSGGMFGRRYDSNGVALSDEFRINDTVAGQQHPTTNAGNRVLTTLSDGTVVSVWGTDHGNGELFFRLVEIPAAFDGTAGEPFDVNLDASLTDIDGSEALTITLSGYPAGSSFSLGAEQGGVWVIENAETLDLSTLQMTAPDGFSGDFTLTATARATEGANGDFAETTASATLSVAAAPLPALFTEGGESINFGGQAAANSIPVTLAGTYLDGTQYNGLGGDDEVWLADTLADAAAAGYDPTQIFNAGDGNDQVYGGMLDDHILGGDGNDRLEDRGGGNNTLVGGEGNDLVYIRQGNDHAEGGNGSDVLRFDTNGPAVIADLEAGTASGQGNDTFNGFEVYGFTNLNDQITGTASNIRVQLFGGDDHYIGGTGVEWLYLGTGNDTFEGGEGVDRVDYSQSGNAVSVDLGAGTATGEGSDVLIGVEQVFGSSQGDLIIGDSTNDDAVPLGYGLGYNALFGGAGDDTVYGMGGDDDLTWQGAGDDLVFGGDGNDGLGGMEGNDTLDGGDGIDTAYYAQMTGDAVINLATGIATQDGYTDTLISIENVTGSRGNDVIIGDGGDNLLHGWFGSDTMTGGAGADDFFFDLRQDYSGDNVVTDFEIGVDVISFLGGGFTTLGDLNPLQVGADVHLDLTNGTTLTLENIALSNLSDSDFDF